MEIQVKIPVSARQIQVNMEISRDQRLSHSPVIRDVMLKVYRDMKKNKAWKEMVSVCG